LLAQALAWRRAETRRDPTDPRGWNDLADDEVTARMDAQARIHYRRALAQDPWSVRALNGLAGVEARRGDRDEAISLLRQSLLVAPDQRSASQALARLEAGLDQ
jgi:Flp pilus assembly protein TadD